MSNCDRLTASGSVSNKPALVTNAAGCLRGWYLFNSNIVTVYLQFFDTVNEGAIILGQTPPVLSLGIPAGSAANIAQDRIRDFANGIVIACTTTRTGAAAPANPIDFNIFFT